MVRVGIPSERASTSLVGTVLFALAVLPKIPSAKSQFLIRYRGKESSKKVKSFLRKT